MNDVLSEYDLVVVGGGPAGLTAAIYTSRADLDTLVLDKGDSTLEKADVIENYFGFPEPVSGPELLERGRKQAKRFGAEIKNLEALSISLEEDNYRVETIEGEYIAEGLVLATGVQQEKPNIDDLDKFEGKGVSYCVVCDGPLFKDKKCGVVGSKDYGLKETLKLTEYTDNVALITNGKEIEADQRLIEKIKEKDIEIIKDEIEKVYGDSLLEGVIINGEKTEFDGLFIAIGTSGTLDFALKLGIDVENGYIKTDRDQSTDLPKLYAAGDCTGGERQISTAVGEGTEAALNLINDIKDEKTQDWG